MGLEQGMEEWGGVMSVRVVSLDCLCRWQVQVSVYCARRIPVFNSVAHYGYLLPTVYLFMADIANPDLFVCSCRAWICLDITRFYEEQRQPSSGSSWPLWLFCQYYRNI